MKKSDRKGTEINREKEETNHNFTNSKFANPKLKQILN